MLPIYYINLASRPDRREYMDGQLAKLGLRGQRIEAVYAKRYIGCR
ncbi:glycosyltransferase family 25 protein [Devosia naphthalenivorans]